MILDDKGLFEEDRTVSQEILDGIYSDEYLSDIASGKAQGFSYDERKLAADQLYVDRKISNINANMNKFYTDEELAELEKKRYLGKYDTLKDMARTELYGPLSQLWFEAYQIPTIGLYGYLLNLQRRQKEAEPFSSKLYTDNESDFNSPIMYDTWPSNRINQAQGIKEKD